MDDLNRPLGKKPKQPKENLGKKILGNNTAILSALAMALGLSAIGFIAYDRFNPKQNNQDQVALNNKSNIDLTQQVPLRNTNNDEEPVNQKPKTENLNGDTSIQVVKPTGTMTEPKPNKPKPKKLPDFKPQKLQNAHLPDPNISQKGATGIIPKQGPNGQRAMDIYAREPDTTGSFGVARVVIILASMGVSQSSTNDAIQKLPPAVTFAFAPYGNSLKRWMQSSRKKGHELLLQLPMEPIGYPNNNPGRETLRTGLSADENITNLHWLMSRITNYVGVMNYLGAKISSNQSALTPIFVELAERGLLYVDDGTSRNSKTQQVAENTLLPYAKGHIRIDKIRTRQEIAKQLQKLAAEAKRTGLAIGVANAFPETINLVAQFAKQAPSNGIEITPVSATVTDPQKK